MLRNIVKTSFKSIKNTWKGIPENNLKPVGRWITQDEDMEKKILRAAQATVDSCGDKLCGDPTVYPKFKKDSGFSL